MQGRAPESIWEEAVNGISPIQPTESGKRKLKEQLWIRNQRNEKDQWIIDWAALGWV